MFPSRGEVDQRLFLELSELDARALGQRMADGHSERDRLARHGREVHTGPGPAGKGDEGEVESALAHLVCHLARSAGVPDVERDGGVL